MKLLETVDSDRLSRRWVLVLVMMLVLVLLGAVSVGVYRLFFGCPRVHASAPPDRLEVKRALSTSSTSPQVPDDWVFGASQVQEVLAALDSLPSTTTDMRYCALADATVYGLSYTFLRGNTIVLQASAPEGGCHIINLSGCDTRQEDGNFLLLMERLLNLPRI